MDEVYWEDVLEEIKELANKAGIKNIVLVVEEVVEGEEKAST